MDFLVLRRTGVPSMEDFLVLRRRNGGTIEDFLVLREEPQPPTTPPTKVYDVRVATNLIFDVEI